MGVQIAEAIDNANEANEANHDPDSVFISGNSKPCLIDILMFGTLRQLKELNSLNCLASPVTTNWFTSCRFVEDCSICVFVESFIFFSAMALEFLSKKKWNPSNIKVFLQ